jgi:hypothetical protein
VVLLREELASRTPNCVAPETFVAKATLLSCARVSVLDEPTTAAQKDQKGRVMFPSWSSPWVLALGVLLVLVAAQVVLDVAWSALNTLMKVLMTLLSPLTLWSA